MNRLIRRRGPVHGVAVLAAVLGITAAQAGPINAGAPQNRVDIAQAAIRLVEPSDPSEPIISVILPGPVISGFLVLTESGPSQDPSNWSDVVRFHNITVGGQVTGEAQLLSDAPGRLGISDTDLAPLGVTVAAIQSMMSTQYRAEGNLGDGTFGVVYAAPNPDLPPGPPGTTATLIYTVVSEVPEPGTLILLGTGTLLLFAGRFRRFYK